MYTLEKETKLNQMIDKFSKDQDIIDTVNRIEGRLATTKGHYGDYMAFLSNYAKDKTALYILSKALIKAGADSYGVQSAMNIIVGQ